MKTSVPRILTTACSWTLHTLSIYFRSRTVSETPRLSASSLRRTDGFKPTSILRPSWTAILPETAIQATRAHELCPFSVAASHRPRCIFFPRHLQTYPPRLQPRLLPVPPLLYPPFTLYNPRRHLRTRIARLRHIPFLRNSRSGSGSRTRSPGGP